MRAIQRLLLILCGLGVQACAWAAPELRVVVTSAWIMPFGEIVNGKPGRGIVLDLYQELGNELGRSVRPIVLPRKRIDEGARTGSYDLVCYINPQWTETPSHYRWSKPIFAVSNVLIGRSGTPAPRDLMSLPKAATVSTVLGYFYPPIQPLFANGHLQRDDAIDEQKLFLKMQLGRTPYGIISGPALDWYLRESPEHKLAPWRLPLISFDVHCAVPTRSGMPAQQLFAALDRLSQAGKIDAILKRYR